MARFVLLYQSLHDPSAQEQGALLSLLKQTRVVDQSPGSLLVEGPEEELAFAVKQCPAWTCSPAQELGVSPPHTPRASPAD